jgi:hypothetical protein
MIALMKDDQGRRMISCREAAELYGCSMRYIRRLASDGKVGSEVVAGSYMVSVDDLRKLKSTVAKGTGRHKPKSEKFTPG